MLLEVRINGEPAEPLSVIVHRDAAYRTGKALCQKLKELIPRQMFKVPIQAAIGGKIIASEQIAPYRKDVLAKCYVSGSLTEGGWQERRERGGEGREVERGGERWREEEHANNTCARNDTSTRRTNTTHQQQHAQHTNLTL